MGRILGIPIGLGYSWFLIFALLTWMLGGSYYPVMLPMEQLKRISPEVELWTALQQMDRDGVNQLPVMNGSQVVGMLSREDVITFLRTLQELGT